MENIFLKKLKKKRKGHIRIGLIHNWFTDSQSIRQLWIDNSYMAYELLIHNWLMDCEFVNQLQKDNMRITYVVLGVPAKRMVCIAIPKIIELKVHAKVFLLDGPAIQARSKPDLD